MSMSALFQLCQKQIMLSHLLPPSDQVMEFQISDSLQYLCQMIWGYQSARGKGLTS